MRPMTTPVPLKTVTVGLLGCGTVGLNVLHLLERRHSERFTALMDGFLPNWGVCRATLNSGVLGHDVWEY